MREAECLHRGRAQGEGGREVIRPWWMILSFTADVAFAVVLLAKAFGGVDDIDPHLCVLIFIKLQAGVGLLINHINKEGDE